MRSATKLKMSPMKSKTDAASSASAGVLPSPRPTAYAFLRIPSYDFNSAHDVLSHLFYSRISIHTEFRTAAILITADSAIRAVLYSPWFPRLLVQTSLMCHALSSLSRTRALSDFHSVGFLHMERTECGFQACAAGFCRDCLRLTKRLGRIQSPFSQRAHHYVNAGSAGG